MCWLFIYMAAEVWNNMHMYKSQWAKRCRTFKKWKFPSRISDLFLHVQKFLQNTEQIGQERTDQHVWNYTTWSKIVLFADDTHLFSLLWRTELWFDWNTSSPSTFNLRQTKMVFGRSGAKNRWHTMEIWTIKSVGNHLQIMYEQNLHWTTNCL